MNLQNSIYKIRADAKLSQAAFAELLSVTPQAVQKWESGAAAPELDKLVLIAKRFGVSLDALILGKDKRTEEEQRSHAKFLPEFANLPVWESYAENLETEFRQSQEEGRDISRYEELFKAVSKLPKGEYKSRIADVLFELVCESPRRKDYPYDEPSEIDNIRALRKPYAFEKKPLDEATLKDKIYGAWLGRICGCLLGKPIEGIRTDELHPFLRETGNSPMRRYILNSDVTDEMVKRYRFPIANRCYADNVDGMPIDDDTNYTVLAQELIERYGRDFTSSDVAEIWLSSQSKNAYCTAERVAFCNFVKGFEPPRSALYKNPYREWIGAQIRGDYFGYINPGNPELAADMAFRDASVSHVKNGIYGEMFVSAMLSCAAVCESIPDVVRGGIAQIPATSRLYESVNEILSAYESGKTKECCFKRIGEKYSEYDEHGWCHTISNAMIVTAALLYGRGDYGMSVCMAVEAGFDTDCNGATVGSILGMRNGSKGVGEEWTKPIADKIHTSIFGVGTVSVKERANMTLRHVRYEK